MKCPSCGKPMDKLAEDTVRQHPSLKALVMCFECFVRLEREVISDLKAEGAISEEDARRLQG